ncbi:hypothetical protein COR50_18340 [Chitinophaga caeni]|uniref:DUF3945 domain-containing protein n=1 Tax=Chitinophaga caeni TaxID=2029983 RepID=A0A291R135_9BACT|nr:DUF3945 domain-containing protein [Chitinophaga caeni]ATL49946.1 hypothetical protein COR50_18340 [Chitinophaga caeni]
MNEQEIGKSTLPDQLSDILLVLDKAKKQIQAVTGVDEHGQLKTVDPTTENEGQFMRVDKNGDIFSNFFLNFFRQIRNPTGFSFFKVPAGQAVDTAQKMQQNLDKRTPEGEELEKQHEVPTPADSKQEQQSSQSQGAGQAEGYRYKPEQIDWETMGNLGLSRDYLEKRNLLDPLLKGYKTNDLVPISLNLGSVITRTDARLSLQPGEDGNAIVAVHGIRKEPNLQYPFFGHEFSKEDKENLLQTGNMGRVVDLKSPKTGEIIPSIVSVDRLTNELVALRTDKIKIPDEIKGVKLDEQQRQDLREGKPLPLSGMISNKGKPFDATLQFNADKRYVEFLFDRNAPQQVQTNGQQQFTEAPKTFRGKELDQEQYQKFKDGQTVYISGLVDKKGRSYQGYITYNADSGKVDFSFDNPAKLREQAKPAEAHKTQTAVNSEGKTNEATKNIKEPLKSGQKEPDSKKQQQEQKPKTPRAKKPKL